MKKIIGSVLCTAVLVAAVGSVMLPVSAVEEKTKTVNVVTIGDSIARGHGCKAEEAYGYLLSQHLKTDLTSSGYTTKFVNYGHDGDTADEMLTKIDDSTEIQDSIKNADVITMSIGGNHVIRGLYYEFAKAFNLDINSPTLEADIMDAFQTTPPLTLLSKLSPIMATKPDVKAGTATPPERMRARADEFQKDMVDVFDRLYTLNSKATILMTTVPNPTNDPTIGKVLEYYMEMYNSYIRTECPKVKNKVLIADCSKTFKEYSGSEALTFTVIDWKDFSKFNLDPHPTPFGHTLMEQTHFALLGNFVNGLKEAAKTSATTTTTTTATTKTTTTAKTAATTTAEKATTTATTLPTTVTPTTESKADVTTAAPSDVKTDVSNPVTGSTPIATGSLVLLAAAVSTLIVTKKKK